MNINPPDKRDIIMHIPPQFTKITLTENHENVNEYEFCTGNSVFIAVSLLVFTVICALNSLLSDGFKFYWIMAVFSGVLFGACTFFLLLITYKSGEWFQLIAATFFDAIVVIVVCTVICISIYTSMSIRGIIFNLLAKLRWRQQLNPVTAWNYSKPYSEDHSLQSGYAILTQFTQNEILKHQNPYSCVGKTLLLGGFNYMGFGGEMHLYARILGMAINNGYIFAWDNNACSQWAKNCRELFIPEHNCTQEDVQTMRPIVLNSIMDLLEINIPRVFQEKLLELELHLTEAQQMYWWKTQGLAFLMRFNNNTINNINAMRSDITVNTRLSGKIPTGTINVNMRTGDKFDEMIGLPEPEDYLNALEGMFQNAPMSFSKWVYITSDNLHAIQELEILASNKGWRVLFSNSPRMDSGYVQGDVKVFWNFNVTISVLMQLSMALECSAWIGTRGSNWNRIIDELRCVHYPKCLLPFKEVAKGIDGVYDSLSALA